nr:MAG TPA: hypothetical protein [Caudoviricetes sp.]DAV18845.1 MAG TPA: hypothetical protein [Caudoviricetes sp.]
MVKSVIFNVDFGYEIFLKIRLYIRLRQLLSA